MKIGILKETKIPHEQRVPLLPYQCLEIQNAYPDIEFLIQKSPHRCIPDGEYSALGLKVADNIEECAVFLGIKEVNKDTLIPNKTYFFFSHTIKGQPQNREMLQKIVDLKIQMIDYECLTDDHGNRLTAFGRFAGIVGAYLPIQAYGLQTNTFHLPPVMTLKRLSNMKQVLKGLVLPPIKIAITGTGRVGKGAAELLEVVPIKEVSPSEFVGGQFAYPVYTLLRSSDYYRHSTLEQFDNHHFYINPIGYQSHFHQFYPHIDILISGHYWNPHAHRLFEVEDTNNQDFKIKVISDISCDLYGSVPITSIITNFESPFIDFNPQSLAIEPAYSNPNNIVLSSIDNLPSALPVDASEDFGQQLIEHVFPVFFNEPESAVIKRATVTKNGQLTHRYAYLSPMLSPG
jgi:saccharopine dehydrogenase (NAD+, L-lysine forming)